MKTFGLVQKGNNGNNSKRRTGVAYKSAQQDNSNNVEKKIGDRMEVAERNELDLTMGFEQYSEGPEKLGWLENIHPTTLYESDDDNGKSGLDMYFIEEDGSKFKATILYHPYFFVICKPNSEGDVEDYLRRRFGSTLNSVHRVQMEDLSIPNHLLGHKRNLLKLSFLNNDDFTFVKRILQPAAEKNKKKQESTGVYEEVHQLATYTADNKPQKITKNHQDVIENIVDLREYDVQYYIRVAIDCDLRVGLWYSVKSLTGQVTISLRSDKVNRADPVVLAFDIETTKLPLKFPDSSFDSIMMISYMVDGQGFLITNKEIVSEDIADFEYTPKPEFEGPFVIFNEDDEISLLKRFFEHIRELKPSIFVTYNGDFFDFPFIEARSNFHNLSMRNEIGFFKDIGDEYKSFNAMHMDCFCWVKRDSYLPQGSQGLKAVTTAKLGYNPMELDPEDMTRFASEQPQTLAQYSVSDAVATYYLYMKYVHPFIFSLCNIIPMNPDDVLRRGSGTLCEHLLMVQSYKANVIMPNKYCEDSCKFYQGHLLESETYVGGHVEALEAGVFRNDIPCKFRLNSDAFQQLIDEVDQALKFSIVVEGKHAMEDIENYDEVKSAIVLALEELRDTPNRIEQPSIYHLDVAAMYPNIILTNRLQPDAVIDESVCASCDFNQGPETSCQRNMEWSWRGEYFPAKRNEYNMIRNQLEQEKFPGRWPKDPPRAFHDMSNSEKNVVIKKRLSDYSRKVYNRIHENAIIGKESIVCQRENPFYINTVRDFRDRRYEYKGLLKTWKKKADDASEEGDTTALDEAKRLIVVYDSLQLAHKCILNSFYGYVMRKGARWYSMEMAGIVCLTGARIIQLARSRVEQIGRPLELDTDGIWCIFPATFPDNFSFKLKNGKGFHISYPCVMLNHLVHDQFTNHQYQDLEDDITKSYSIHSENSIFFEVDGPYRAMILPSSTEEDKLLKKRYAVFNEDGTLAELKGFEVKRRGELKLIKIFQTEIFKSFLLGGTLDECYTAVAEVANRWLDVLYSKGVEHTDEELFDLISENRSMSKSLQEYGAQKSTSISTAKRLAEFLGDQMVKDKGLNCKFIISAKPADSPVSERAIPVVIFQTEPAIRKHFLRKWLKDNSLQTFDIRDILDWKYYMERFGSVIQKLITIPAAMQGVTNPVPRVRHPDWLFRRVAAQDDKTKQFRITDMFKPAPLVSEEAIIDLNYDVDIEDIRFSGAHSMPPNIPESSLVEIKSKKIPIPDMYTDYDGWLEHQKLKWKNRRIQRKKDKLRFGVDLANKISSDRNGVSGFLHRQTVSILTDEWHVLQIVEQDTPGDFRVWALIKDKMHCIKITVSRTFYVNSRYHDPKYDKDSGSYKVTRVVKNLPRSQPCYYLYEFNMVESFYSSNAGKFSQLFNHEKIEGVYELQVPLLLRALIQLGCIVSVQKSRISQNANRDTFDLIDLQGNPKVKDSYLGKTSKLNQLFLFHSTSENGARQIYGLFSIPGKVLWVYVVDPAKNNDALPNIKRLYTDKKSSRDSQISSQTQDLKTEDVIIYPDTFDVRVSLHAREIDAINAMNASLTEYQDQRRGPTMISLQSCNSSRHLQMLGVSNLYDFPIISVPFHKKDNSFPALGWQSYSLARMMEHFLNLNDFLKDRFALARYGDVPICNIDHDYTIFFADLFFARRLKRAEMLLWYSPSEKPDLGGREQDDNKHDLEELVNPEINVPGNYCTVCIEFDVWDLALNTLMQSNMFNEFENSLGGASEPKAHLMDRHLQNNSEKEEQNTVLGFGGSVDENRISSATFGIIKQMVRAWSEEVTKRNRIGSTMLEHLYRWITSASSCMYDPALYSLVHDLMKRIFIHLIADIRNLGSQIVFASFQKIVIATTKNELPNAISYVTYVLKTLLKNDLFKHLDIKPTQVWEHLIWMDSYNYGGIICENPEDLVGVNTESGLQGLKTAVDFKWNMADYLPPACKRRFLKLMAEYIYEIHYFKENQQDSKKNKENETDKSSKIARYGLPGKRLEQLSIFLQEILSTTIKRRLLTVVREIQKSELMEDDVENLPFDFPVLPGSHLSLKNPALEFVKLICKVFSLDSTVNRESRLLRRDLLNLIGVREFSEEAKFINPCEAFSLPQVICDFCNHCQDLDLTREEDTSIETDQGEQNEENSWSCPACHTLYDKMSIEQRLVNIVRKRLLTWQLQDLKCERCKFVRADEIRDTCAECSGKLITELSAEEFKRKMIVFSNIAQYYEMEMLNEVVEWRVFVSEFQHFTFMSLIGKSSGHSYSIDDEKFSLKEQNQNLKKKLNDQDDKSKKLMAKIQRLSEDLHKAHKPAIGALPPAKPHAVLSKKEEIEAYSLIDDLRLQVKELNKQNSAFKNKMHFFQALHEAETRKRTPYDHIPPRIVTGNRPKRPASSASARVTQSNSLQKLNGNEETYDSKSEQIEKLEELTNVLRMKLTSAESEAEKARQEYNRLYDSQDDIQRQDDIDRLSLQHELVEHKRKTTEQKIQLDEAEAALRLSETNKKDAVHVAEKLTKELKEERLKNLLALIDELRAEIKTLEEEQARLIDSRFGAVRNDQYEKEMGKLHAKIRKLEIELADQLKEKSDLNSSVQTLSAELKEAISNKSKLEIDIYNLMEEMQQLRDKLRFLNANGEIDLGEINDALALLRLKKEKGLSLEFLEKIDEYQNDKRVLLELRAQYADCIQDLEKTRKLLSLQEQINKDYKIQIDRLKERLELLKNEYELRLEEDCRLLDIRGHKIAQLEAQLKNIAYGTSKVPIKASEISKADEYDLAKGENIIDIQLEAALFTEAAFQLFHDIGLDSEDPEMMTTFILFDFYEFETQLTPLGIGSKPHYGFKSRFKLYVDDFFLYYLQTQVMNFRVCRSNGIDFVEVGTCVASFKGILQDNKVEKLKYYGDILSKSGSVIGKLDYSIEVHIPMSQAIRSFKERTVALNLLTAGDSKESEKRFQQRSAMNHLNVAVGSMHGLSLLPNSAVYVSFTFLDDLIFTTNTIKGNTRINFKFLKLIPLSMGTDLDRFLRASDLIFYVMDEVQDIVYGIVTISLAQLALNEAISDSFGIYNENGEQCGSLEITMSWETPYKPTDIVPVVSLLDTKFQMEEFNVNNGNQKKEVALKKHDVPESSLENESPLLSAKDSRLSESYLTDSIATSLNRFDSVKSVNVPLDICHPDEPEKICIGFNIVILEIKFNMENPVVADEVKRMSQIFVSFDFLSFPAEELETESAIVDIATGVCKFRFEKYFPMDPVDDAREVFSLSRFLKSKQEIIFSVVSEPSEDTIDGVCVDICFGTWDLNNGGLLEIPLVSDGTNYGTMKMECTGIECLDDLKI